MTRLAGPFAPPPPKATPKVKRDTPDEAAERKHVWLRDQGCVARLIRMPGQSFTLAHVSPCDGPLSYDHVRASGGLGMKSPTHRTNGVILCLHHHRAKTEYGKTWRPLLLTYLERVEPQS